MCFQETDLRSLQTFKQLVLAACSYDQLDGEKANWGTNILVKIYNSATVHPKHPLRPFAFCMKQARLYVSNVFSHQTYE